MEEYNVKPNGRYSTRETCIILGICRNTLAKKERDGLIIGHKIKGGRDKFFKGVEIQKYLNSVIINIR